MDPSSRSNEASTVKDCFQTSDTTKPRRSDAKVSCSSTRKKCQGDTDEEQFFQPRGENQELRLRNIMYCPEDFNTKPNIAQEVNDDSIRPGTTDDDMLQETILPS